MSDLTQTPDELLVVDGLLVDVTGAWCEVTCPECVQSVTFVNPTARRMAWFTGSPRCGASTWQGT